MRILSCLALVLAGCGGSATTSPGDAATGLATDAGAGSSSDASTSPTSDASTSPASDAAAAPMDGASVSPYALPYLPLSTGLSWTMKMTMADGSIGTSCENDGSMLTVTVTDSDAASATESYTPGCFYDSIDYAISGGIVSTGGYEIYAFPPTQGGSWAGSGASSATYEWDQHFDSYTVAAGTFMDCWHLSINSGGYEQVLCKDVGVVLSAGTQFQDYRWELVSKSF
jgi:hypothetical protein